MGSILIRIFLADSNSVSRRGFSSVGSAVYKLFAAAVAGKSAPKRQVSRHREKLYLKAQGPTDTHPANPISNATVVYRPSTAADTTRLHYHIKQDIALHNMPKQTRRTWNSSLALDQTSDRKTRISHHHTCHPKTNQTEIPPNSPNQSPVAASKTLSE